MREYLVTWKIDVMANSEEYAAIEAFNIMRDKNSSATIFEVSSVPKTVDVEDIL